MAAVHAALAAVMQHLCRLTQRDECVLHCGDQGRGEVADVQGHLCRQFVQAPARLDMHVMQIVQTQRCKAFPKLKSTTVTNLE